MTLELLDQQPVPSDEFFIAWLTPLGRTGIKINDDTPLPFRRVQTIDIRYDDNLFTACAVVSVHTLCDSTIDHAEVAAKNETDQTDRRILYLARHLDTIVTLQDGRQIGLDYLDVIHASTWIDDDNDQLYHKVGRYEIGLNFDAVT